MTTHHPPRTPLSGNFPGIGEGRAYAFAAQDHGVDPRCTFKATRFGAFWSLLLALSAPEPSGGIACRYLAVSRRPLDVAYRSWTDQGEFYRYENAYGHWAIVPLTDGLSELDVCVLPVPGVNAYLHGDPHPDELRFGAADELTDQVAQIATAAGWTAAATREALVAFLGDTGQDRAVLTYLRDVAAAEVAHEPIQPGHICPYRCGYDTPDEKALIRHVDHNRCPRAPRC